MLELKDQNSPHSLTIAKLYGINYLIHIQCLTGILKIFQITNEKVEEIKKMILKIGQYGIRAVDNLIIMQNSTLQETYVIDIKSEKYNDRPYCMFWNSMKEALPIISIKLRAFIEKPKVIVQSTFFYDGKPIKYIKEFTEINSLGGEATECIMKINPEIIFVDNDICVDTKAGRCYKLQFSPMNVIKYHPDRIEGILFLFRRTGYKTQAYDFFKDCIQKYINIKEISYLFEIISRNYKHSIVEKKINDGRRSMSLSKSDLYTRRLSTSLEPELKIGEGSVVLFQSDIFSIFLSLVEDNTVKTEYLASLLQEYIRSLTNLDIEVQNSIQLLLARMLIKCSNFLAFQDLVLYNIFTDSYEMVGFLAQLIPNYDNALQLSIDMLFRMRYNEKLIDVMLDKDFVYETLNYLSKVSYPRFDIRKLLAKCEEIGDEQMTYVVTQFIKEKSLA